MVSAVVRAMVAPRIPNLYEVTCELLDPDGVLVETSTHRVGLRRVEVRDRQLLVNGQPIWIFGVNRHDHHPDRGKAVNADDIRADLQAMRAPQHHRRPHVALPERHRVLTTCATSWGMYVIDEANIESHAYNVSICDDARLSRGVARPRCSHGAARPQPSRR